ncbi:MAG: flagellar M-ring protein FliF [Lachnospiraceae bacterium]
MEQLKKILNRILELWNKYTRKQKAIIISVAGVIIIALAILVMVVQKPTWVTIRQCESYSEMNEVTQILTSGGYEYQIDDSNFTVRVKQQDLTNAKMTLASTNIAADGYTIKDALNSSFSTTESDRNRMWQKYLESEFSKDLAQLDAVKSASVRVTLANNSSVLVNNKNEHSVAAVITPNGAIDSDMAESIAKFLATSVGNTTTNKITVITTSGQTLFAGNDSSSTGTGGSIMSPDKQERYKAIMEDSIKTSIRQSVLSMGLYDDVTVNLNMRYNFDYVTKILTEYSVPEGNEQGYLKSSYELESTGGTGASGVPGTVTNDDDTSYMLQDGYGNSSTYTVKQYEYTPNVLITNTTGSGVEVEYENSTMAITFKKNVVYKEEEAEELGLVNDQVTWEQFKNNNSEPVKINTEDIDADWTRFFAYATGIDEGNITIIAYENHFFEDIPTGGSGQSVSFWIQIALAAVILALLAFVVIRSAKPLTVEETEPELSVEDMLATTKEQQPTVEDIDLQSKSETRKAIEKFVDENPEAVALLLRNWLNEGWD